MVSAGCSGKHTGSGVEDLRANPGSATLDMILNQLPGLYRGIPTSSAEGGDGEHKITHTKHEMAPGTRREHPSGKASSPLPRKQLRVPAPEFRSRPRASTPRAPALPVTERADAFPTTQSRGNVLFSSDLYDLST